jgi:hypothetical protein
MDGTASFDFSTLRVLTESAALLRCRERNKLCISFFEVQCDFKPNFWRNTEEGTLINSVLLWPYPCAVREVAAQI